MVTASKVDREFCAACGWPLGGMRCEACGAERVDLDLRDATLVEVTREPEGIDAGDKAAEAFRNKEWTRFVGSTVTAEGGASARTAATDDGPGWIASVGGALLFVTLELVGHEVLIEAPLVRLPRTKRVAALRAALEGLGPDGAVARACLRDDLLLLRARVRLFAASPALVRRVIRETAGIARQAIEMLGAMFLARPVVAAADRGHVGFEALGAPRRLAKAIADTAPLSILVSSRKQTPLGVRAQPAAAVPEPSAKLRGTGPFAGAPVPSVPTAVHAAPETRPEPDEADEPGRDSLPPILAPLLAMPKKASVPPPGAPTPGPAPPARKSMPPPLPARPVPNPPPALGGLKPRPNAPIVPPPPPVPTLGQSSSSAGKPAAPPLPARDAVKAFADDRKRTIKDSPRANGGRMATLEIEAVGPDLEPEAGRRSPSGEIAIMPIDRFCALLKRGQMLGGAALGAGSSALPWLVRAAVFRAVYEFRDQLPDAVAHLYRACGVTVRDRQTAPSPEQALAIFELLIEAKGEVAKEKPLSIEALTSAQQAKDHVSRYIAEIERSAAEPGLRHYLSLGALCELLVRAKLPSQTSQRLRDIIAHAQREGAKPQAIELLMTALKRISA